MTTAFSPKLDLDTDQLARDYEEISATRQFQTGKRLVADLAIGPGEHVIDVGCGTGLLAQHIADIVGPAGRVVGVDPLPLRIDLANRKAGPTLAFQVGDANDLSSFPPASFDAVVLNAVFHWLPEKTRPLGQFARLLKTGGRLGISTGDKSSRGPMQQAIGAALARPPFDRYPRPRDGVIFRVDADEMRVLLRGSGFAPDLIEVRENEQLYPSPEAALRFSEASSFGNVFAHLPDELKPAARQAAIEALGKIAGPDGGIVRKARRLVAIATRVGH